MSGVFYRAFLTIIPRFTERSANILVGGTIRQTAFVPHPASAGFIKINFYRQALRLATSFHWYYDEKEDS